MRAKIVGTDSISTSLLRPVSKRPRLRRALDLKDDWDEVRDQRMA
jgi:hypothetical protein